jgi:hypothetical protein
MKKPISLRAGAGLALLLGILFSAGAAVGRLQVPEEQETNPQQIQKPTYDYMSNYLSRSTRPLGLNVDPLAKEILSQKSAKWAVRAGARHVLD